MSKNIAVFAGNNCFPEVQSQYFPIAYKTGQLLAQHGYTTVSGAGNGMMNETLKGAYEAGGHTIGVILELKGRSASQYLAETFSYPALKPRQQKLMELSQGFLAVPGGIGTLYEVIELIAHKRVHEIDGSIPLILIGTYYAGLRDCLATMESDGFISPPLGDMVRFVDTPEEAIGILDRHFALTADPVSAA